MMARGIEFRSDGILCNDEEARMFIPGGVEGIDPVLSAV